jgi:hypothetical protein
VFRVLSPEQNSTGSIQRILYFRSFCLPQRSQPLVPVADDATATVPRSRIPFVIPRYDFAGAITQNVPVKSADDSARSVPDIIVVHCPKCYFADLFEASNCRNGLDLATGQHPKTSVDPRKRHDYAFLGEMAMRHSLPCGGSRINAIPRRNGEVVCPSGGMRGVIPPADSVSKFMKTALPRFR